MDGADVVDYISEIPLPGRTLASRLDGAVSANPIAVKLPAFVAGPENRLVAASFRRLIATAGFPGPFSAAPGTQLMPTVLALFGPTGSGKTHLSRGLVRHWQQSRGQASAEYATAQDFRRQLNEAISGNGVLDLRSRLRTREMIAIDELHSLPNDDYLLQELRFTLDALDESGGIVVVTSTRPVTTLSNLTPDLRSRLASGLMLQVAAPGPAARMRIVQHVSSALGRPLSDEVVNRLAAGLRGTVNQLLGALFQLFAELPESAAASAEFANRLLTLRNAHRPSLREIVTIVAKHYRLPQKLLKSNSRKQSAVLARATVVYLARELSEASYEQIGRVLGGRDHTTMMHSFRKIERERQHDFAMQEALDDLRRVLLSC